MGKARRETKIRVQAIKDKNGQVIAEDVKLNRSFKEYFE